MDNRSYFMLLELEDTKILILNLLFSLL